MRGRLSYPNKANIFDVYDRFCPKELACFYKYSDSDMPENHLNFDRHRLPIAVIGCRIRGLISLIMAMFLPPTFYRRLLFEALV